MNLPMPITPLHPDAELPLQKTTQAVGYDIAMISSGILIPDAPQALKVPLGFAASVPVGNVAMIFPRSGVGANGGLSLNNTVGIIDPDYTGEWCAYLRNRNKTPFHWFKGDRLLQFVVLPVTHIELTVVEHLHTTERGGNGFGSTG